jgi:hypothetical protein
MLSVTAARPALPVEQAGRDGGSVSGAVCMIVHADFDLDACLCDREFAGQRCDQFGRRFERIDDFLAPRVVFRLLFVGEPDLNHIAVLFLADAGEQLRVARLVYRRFEAEGAGLLKHSHTLQFGDARTPPLRLLDR